MITAKELAKEIYRIKGGAEPDAVGFATALLPFIQSRAAGVQGAEHVVIDAHWLENIAAAAALLSGGDSLISRREGEALYTLVKSARRLATPKPPNTIRVDVEQIGSCELDVRDGVAYMPAVTVQDIVSKSCLKPQPPKDAGAVPSFNREHAAKTIADSILRSPTNSVDENNDSVSLLDVLANAFGDKTVGPAMDWMIDAVFEALEDFPQHQPSEPAARAQEAMSECICDGAAYSPNQTHPFLVNRACPKHGEPHPSPAHAGAGDAHDEYLRIYHIAITVCGDQPTAAEIARRLAGGDHA